MFIEGNLLIKINRMLFPGLCPFLKVKWIFWIKSIEVIIQQVDEVFEKVEQIFPKLPKSHSSFWSLKR